MTATPAARTARPTWTTSTRDALQRWVEVPLVCAGLPLPRGGSVLELGCGAGNALAPLRQALRPSLLVGVDLQTPVGVCADASALPFADGTFDAVVDFGTCQEVGTAALLEVARVLRPGGVFVHETGWAQLLAHPQHGWRPLDTSAVSGLLPRVRTLGLWTLRRRA